MAMNARLIFVFVFGSCAFSCEERISWFRERESVQVVAVEGVLTNENTNHRVRLSYPYQEMNGTPAPVVGALVEMTDGSATFNLIESPPGSGEYLTGLMRAVFGKTYTLHIRAGGKDFYAQDRSVPVEPMNAIDYVQSDSDPSLYKLNFSKSGSGPSYVTHALNWQSTGSCVSGQQCEARIVYYDLKTIDVNEVFKPGKEDLFFPAGTTIVRRKFSASPAYQEFLRTVLSETEWRGGVFDVQRANASTNLSAGAIGFFAVSTVVADTTVVVEKP